MLSHRKTPKCSFCKGKNVSWQDYCARLQYKGCSKKAQSICMCVRNPTHLQSTATLFTGSHQSNQSRSLEGSAPCRRGVAYSKGWQNKNNQRHDWLPEFTLTEPQSWRGVIQSHKTALFAVECWGALIQRSSLLLLYLQSNVLYHWKNMRNGARSSFRRACLCNTPAVSLIKCQERVSEYHKNYRWSINFLQLIYQGLHMIWEIIYTVTFICTSHC